jgi:hypothetical protein
MPCTRTFYESSTLFPVFAQHLPVGANREWLVNFLGIQNLSKGAQDMSLLAASGYNGMGHCGFVNADAPSLKPRYTVNPLQLLQARDSQQVFMDWRNKYGAQGMGVGASCGHGDSLCLLLNTKPAWPVPNVLAVLGSNSEWVKNRAQHLSLMRDAGVLCPMYECSQDGRVLLLERHDLNAKGQRLPVESLASLCGLGGSVTEYSNHLNDLNTQYLIAERVLKVFSVRFEQDLNALKRLKLLPGIRPLDDLCFVGDQLATTII